MRQQTYCFWAGLVAVVALWLGLAVLFGFQTPRMAPIKPGNLDEFWKRACGVDLEYQSVVRNRWLPRIYGPFDGWYVYEGQHIHGSLLFSVRADGVRNSFEAVIAVLKEPGNRDVLEPAVRQGLIS